MTSDRRALKTAAVGFAIVAAVSVIIGTSYYLWLQLSGEADYQEAASRLDADIARAKELGVPLVAADLDPSPPVPNDQNAATLYLQATSAIQFAHLNEFNIQVAAESGDFATLQSFLAPALPAMELAAKAATKPRCDIHRDWDLGPNFLLPDLSYAKRLVKALSARAEMEAARGDHDAALADLGRALEIGKDAGSDSLAISALVEIACEAIMELAAERCIDSASDEETLQKYERFFDSGPPKIDFKRMLKVDSYIGTSWMRNVDLFGMPDGNSFTTPHIDPDMIRRTGIPTNERARAYMARNLELWNAVFADNSSSTDPYHMFYVVDSLSQADHGPHKPSYTLLKTVNPYYSDIASAFDKAQATWQVTRALAKVLTYKMKNGKYPSRLADVGFKEIDPYSGKPYGYKVDGKSVRIYSIGRDRKDNGGMRQTESRPGDTSEYDVAASFPPVEAMHYPTRPKSLVRTKWRPRAKAKP